MSAGISSTCGVMGMLGCVIYLTPFAGVLHVKGTAISSALVLLFPLGVSEIQEAPRDG